MSNLDTYNSFRSVPEDAKKTIGAGRLKGMTDINPMWRIFKLTEKYGEAGHGWYIEILNRWIEDGADGERCAFVEIALYTQRDGEWSKPIIGTGGSKFIANERNGKYTSDEAFKMAYTDAISVACKALGIGADVYWQGGRTKYNATPTADPIREEMLKNPQVITETQIANLEGIFEKQPDGGKILKTLLLNGKEIKDLTNVEYGELLHKMNKRDENIKAVKTHIATYADHKHIERQSEALAEIEKALNVKIPDDIGLDCSELCAKIQRLAQQ